MRLLRINPNVPGAMPVALDGHGVKSGRAPGDGSPSTRSAYLDGIRALAALYVAAYHAYIAYVLPGLPSRELSYWNWLTYGPAAVAAFIAVSGYCLGRTSHTGANFFARRAWRILPPYWAAIALSLLVMPATATQILAHLFLVNNLRATWSLKSDYVLWSVATECQFYLCFPILVAIARRDPLRAGLLSILAALAASYALGRLGLSLGASPWLLIAFTAGILLANARKPILVLTGGPAAGQQFAIIAQTSTTLTTRAISPKNHPDHSIMRIMVQTLPAVLLVLLLSVETLCPDLHGYGSWAHQVFRQLMVAGITLSAIAQCNAAPQGRLAKLLSARPLVAIGTISYSLYLVHVPILEAFHAHVPPIALPALVLAGSALFFLIFERPFLRYPTPSNVKPVSPMSQAPFSQRGTSAREKGRG